jgi:hypothetical protein
VDRPQVLTRAASGDQDALSRRPRPPYTAPAVRREVREVIADWLLLFGAVALLVSLFLPWSHQFSHAFLAEWSSTGVLRGIPRDPTAWQVYSVADGALALLVATLLVVALIGGRLRRFAVLLGAAVALAFTVHAASAPPTNGAVLPAGSVANSPRSGAGETVAIAGLAVALAGLALSFTAD